MKKLTKKILVKFLEDLTGEKNGASGAFKLMSGKEGKQYSEYSCGKWWVNIEESYLYDVCQGTYGWAAQAKLIDFLAEYGYYYENGYSWDMAIMEG